VSIANTKDKIAKTVSDLSSTASDSIADTQGRLADSAHAAQDKIGDVFDAVNTQAKNVQKKAQESMPLGTPRSPMLPLLGIAGVAFAAGYFIPLSSIEKKRLGPIGSELARRGSEARDEVLAQGQAVINETVSAAKSSLKTHSDEAAEHLGVAEKQTETQPS